MPTPLDNRTDSKVHCLVCKSDRLNIEDAHFATFRHLDFEEFPLTAKRNSLAECENCGHIFRVFSPADELLLKHLYQSSEYASHKEEHMITLDPKEEPISLAVVQARLLDGCLPKRVGGLEILDVGCFDGKLLSALAQRNPIKRCVGFDVGRRPGFPSRSDFYFVSGNLDQVGGSFDLITFSQSLMYVEDLAGLFANVDRLLSDSGKVFIHLPNILRRPSALLFGDQYHYFHPNSIFSLLSRFGFEASLIQDTPFGRDLVLVANRKTRGRELSEVNIVADTGTAPQNRFLREALGRVERLANDVGLVSAEPNLAVFGTTIDAAFVDSLIPSKVMFFVDENPARVGIRFHGKRVESPSRLQKDSVCILPMEPHGEPLRARLSSMYEGVFHLV
jgi:SAM-dependent methyltransferase